MLDQTVLSERRACRLAGLSRDAFRHPPEPTPATQALSARIVELAQVRRRFGYRRLHDLLRPEFPDVNHKKVYRLYREASLAVRRRKKAKRPPLERQPLATATATQSGLEHGLRQRRPGLGDATTRRALARLRSW
jgi:putative transposase